MRDFPKIPVVARRVIEITKEFSGVTTIDITRDTTFEQQGKKIVKRVKEIQETQERSRK